MDLYITISRINAKVSLFDNNREIDSASWRNNWDLSRLLLFNMDRILKKHDIKVSEIGKFEFQNEENTGFTTSHIGEITTKVLEFANKYQ